MKSAGWCNWCWSLGHSVCASVSAPFRWEDIPCSPFAGCPLKASCTGSSLQRVTCGALGWFSGRSSPTESSHGSSSQTQKYGRGQMPGGVMGWGEGIVKEFWLNMFTLLYFRWITNKDLLYSTGNSAQCYGAARMGGTSGGERILVYVWLSCFSIYLKLSQHC